MQRAEDSSSRVAGGPGRIGLRPATAFLLLLLVLGVVTAIVLLTRPSPAPTPTATGDDTTTEPNFSLTNEEAIARFEELNEQLLSAYANRDPSLISEFLTSESPLRRRARNEIERLIHDRVIPDPVFVTRSVKVISNESSQIVIRQSVVDSSRFLSEKGEDITDTPKDILRVVEWTLELERSVWKIASSEPLKSRVL